jgi:hypothetical protein
VLTVAVGEVKGALSHVELGKDVTYSDAYQGSTGQVVCKESTMATGKGFQHLGKMSVFDGTWGFAIVK